MKITRRQLRTIISEALLQENDSLLDDLLTDNSLDAVLQGLELAESLGLFPEAKYIKFKPGKPEYDWLVDRLMIKFNSPEEAAQFLSWVSGYIKPEEQIGKQDIGRLFLRQGREKPKLFLIKPVTPDAIKQADYFFGRQPELDSEEQADLDFLKEAMENSPFQFSINPAEYISKDQPIDEMNQMISLILDSDGISYYSERRNFLGDSSILYQFGYADAEDGDSDEEDPESYEAFEALVNGLRNAGVLTTDQVRNDRDLRDNTHFSFESSVSDRTGIKSGYLILKQRIK